MKQIVCFLFCMLFSVTMSAQDKTAALSGKWGFNASDVPYGYEKGNLEFKTTEGKLSATVRVQGNTIAIEQIKKQADTYICNFYLDGSNVEIILKPKAEKLEADVKVDGTLVEVSFKRQQ